VDIMYYDDYTEHTSRMLQWETVDTLLLVICAMQLTGCWSRMLFRLLTTETHAINEFPASE